MLTKRYGNMITLHTHTQKKNCYRQVAESLYAIFVRNVNIISKNKIKNLVKESEFL